MNEELEERTNKKGRIKKHFQNNWKLYTGVVIGAIGMYVLTYNKREITELVIKIKGDHNNPNMTYQTITNYGNVVGRPGTKIVDITTGHDYKSITLGAKAMSVDYGEFLDALNKGLEINGHKFIRVTEAV